MALQIDSRRSTSFATRRSSRAIAELLLASPSPDHLHLPDDHLGLPYRGSVDQDTVERGSSGAGLMRGLHRRQDRFGAVDFFFWRRVNLVGELNLTRMDRPLAFAAKHCCAVEI